MIETDPNKQVTAENSVWVELSDGRGFIAKSMGSVVVLERVDVVTGHFVYVTVNNIRLRETASFAHPRSCGLKSGTVVEASALVRAEGTLFVLCSNGSGWLFESKDGKIAMEPAAIEEGLCQVRVTSAVIVRETASYAHRAMSHGKYLTLKSGAIIGCNMRLSIEGTTFFKLQDGRGWVIPMSLTCGTAIIGSLIEFCFYFRFRNRMWSLMFQMGKVLKSASES